MNRTLVLAVLALVLLVLGALLLLSRNAVPPTRGAPAATEAALPPAPAPATAAPDGEAGGPANSFVVCPGNPRCPKEGK